MIFLLYFSFCMLNIFLRSMASRCLIPLFLFFRDFFLAGRTSSSPDSSTIRFFPRPTSLDDSTPFGGRLRAPLAAIVAKSSSVLYSFHRRFPKFLFLRHQRRTLCRLSWRNFYLLDRFRGFLHCMRNIFIPPMVVELMFDSFLHCDKQMRTLPMSFSLQLLWTPLGNTICHLL